MKIWKVQNFNKNSIKSLNKVSQYVFSKRELSKLSLIYKTYKNNTRNFDKLFKFKYNI